MQGLVETIIEIDFDDLDNLKTIVDERFGLIVKYNEIEYKFLIHMKSNSKILFVLGSGMLPENEMDKFKGRPLFKRQSWDLKPEVMESTIFFDDPTRNTYPELLGGWGIGSPQEWYIENISLILSKIFDIYNIKKENIIFYSSSMGGFMSIQLGTLIPGTTVWADIPQTDLYKTDYFYRLSKVIFGEDYFTGKNHRFKCVNLMEKEKYIPPIYLVITCFEDDLNRQIYPFLQELEDLPIDNVLDKIRIVINPINGHMFLSYKEFIMLKNKYFSSSINFKEIEFLSYLKNNSVNIIKQDNHIDKPLVEFVKKYMGSNMMEYNKNNNELNNVILGNPKLINSKVYFNGNGNILFCEEDVLLKDSVIIFSGDNSLVFLSENKSDYKLTVEMFTDCSLYFGKNNYMTNNIRFVVQEHANILIGNNNTFSNNIKFRTSDAHAIYDIDDKKRINNSGNILIGDHIWVCADVSILKNTEIGSGAIIESNSIVSNKLIYSNTLNAGIPIRKIKDNVCFDPKFVGNDSFKSNFEYNYELNDYIFNYDENEILLLDEYKNELFSSWNISKKMAFFEEIGENSSKNRFFRNADIINNEY